MSKYVSRSKEKCSPIAIVRYILENIVFGSKFCGGMTPIDDVQTDCAGGIGRWALGAHLVDAPGSQNKLCGIHG